MDFFVEQSEIIGNLQTEVIYQFTCILERERNRNIQEVVSEDPTFKIKSTGTGEDPAAGKVTGSTSSALPVKDVEESAQSVITVETNQTMEVDDPPRKVSKEAIPTTSTETIAAVNSTVVPKIPTQLPGPTTTLSKESQFNKLSQLNIEILTQPMQNRTKKAAEAEPTTEKLPRIVPKLARSSTLNSASSYIDFTREGTSMAPSLTESSIQESQHDQTQSDRDTRAQDSSSDGIKEVKETKEVKEVVRPLKREPSAILQSLAELRKGLAMNKKKQQSRIAEQPSLPLAAASESGSSTVSEKVAAAAEEETQKTTEGEGNVEKENSAAMAVDDQPKHSSQDETIAPSQEKVAQSPEILKDNTESITNNAKPNSSPNLAAVDPQLQLVNKDDAIEAVSEPENFADSMILDVEPVVDNDQSTEEGEIMESLDTAKGTRNDEADQIPSNLFTGAVTFISNDKSDSDASKSTKPVTSFLPLVQQATKPKEKPKPEIKALQKAALAAKKEQEDREKKLKLKDERQKLLAPAKKDDKFLKELVKETKKDPKKPVVESLKRPNDGKDLGGVKKKVVTVATMEKEVASTPSKLPVKKPTIKPKLPILSSKLGNIKNPVLQNLKQDAQADPQSPKSALIATQQEVNKLGGPQSIVDSKGEIQGINDEDSSDDTDSDHPSKPKPVVPIWAQSPFLKTALQNQQKVDPDAIFKDLERPNIKEIMGRGAGRPSVMEVEVMDDLSGNELIEYKKKMGFLEQ